MDTGGKGEMKMQADAQIRAGDKNLTWDCAGLLTVQMYGASGGLTLREQHLLEENTQWKLSFLLFISVVE